jgi:Zn-dependent M28 family amino/carboxypeptidase
MRILNALGIKPRRTIRIALWSGEEEGLIGSMRYVEQHFGSFPRSTAPGQMARPEFLRQPAGPLTLKPEQKLVSAYFNIDNGGGRIRGIYTQGNAAVDPIFAQWMAPLRDLGVTTISNRNTGGTDHLSFVAAGIPGFQFIQDPLDYESRVHHTDLDTYDHLRIEDMKEGAVVLASMLVAAADADKPLPRKPVPTEPKLTDPYSYPEPIKE